MGGGQGLGFGAWGGDREGRSILASQVATAGRAAGGARGGERVRGAESWLFRASHSMGSGVGSRPASPGRHLFVCFWNSLFCNARRLHRQTSPEANLPRSPEQKSSFKAEQKPLKGKKRGWSSAVRSLAVTTEIGGSYGVIGPHLGPPPTGPRNVQDLCFYHWSSQNPNFVLSECPCGLPGGSRPEGADR